MTTHPLFDRTRHFRHAKHPTLHPQLLLQERDWHILETVQRYRVIDTNTLGKLLSHQGSDDALIKRLRKLWRAEYLDRPKEALYLRLIGQEPCLLWAIARKGYAALAPRLGLPLDNYQARRQKQLNDDIKAATLAHNLSLNKFRAAIELATRAHDQIRLVFWNQHQLKKISVTPPQPQLTLFNVPEHTVTLIPDALFALEFFHEPSPHNPAEKAKAHFYVEYDNATTPLSRFVLKKGLGYGQHFSTDLSARAFKFFQVLIVASTPTRKDNLRAAIATWLAQAKHKGTAYPETLWLFSDKTMYDLESPQSVLGSIWQSATSAETRSLLD